MSATFKQFQQALQAQLKTMEATGLYKVNVEKDIIWDTYLDSFPEGTNNMYKERREYDCNCCKQFVRNAGRIVTIKDGKMVSIWDITIDGYYQEVANALSQLVKSKEISDKYFHYEQKVGSESTTDDNFKTWNHLAVKLPSSAVMRKDSIPTTLNAFRTNQSTLLRSLNELTLDSAETVLELIAQNSLYRGEEHVRIVKTFVQLKREFDAAKDKALFCWTKSGELGGVSNIRGTVIGTLLDDLSSGVDLEKAVKSFEAKVAPTNYKRPTALVTKGMIESAQKKVVELGLEDSLARRFAVTEDLTINNVLFADRSAKAVMNVFDELKASTVQSSKLLEKVEEIGIEEFIKNVLPKVSTIEIMVENRHKGNLVSLIAPQTEGAPNLFKWNNGFSWSYNGDVTDTIKERVKAAGGNVEGDLRVSLSWYNPDDLDLHVYEPKGEHLYFRNKRNTKTGGFLDLDMNGIDKHDDKAPVENLVWKDSRKMNEGVYRVVVNQWSKRMNDREGFEVELDFKGTSFVFSHPQAHRSGDVAVVEFKYTHEKGVEILKSIGHTKQTKEVWGINTETFQKVSLVMNSPNHWDGEETGNKHYFFMLEGCKNPDSTRGFYNEYLKQELNDHRKVFEMLSGKMKVEHTDKQLSGVGFSSTNRNHAFVKVTGNFTRTLKVVF